MLAMTMMVDFASAAPPRIFRGSSAAATAVSTMLVHYVTIYRDIAEVKVYLNSDRPAKAMPVGRSQAKIEAMTHRRQLLAA